MLKLEHVKKQYKDFHLDCSLTVKPGMITGLIGANGAGKSTTFKAVLGLIRTESGMVELFGKRPEEITPEDKERLGVVLADSGFSGYLSIRDLIPVLKAMYHQFDQTYFEEQCRRFELPMTKKIKEFSTGMKRKLQVLAAISHHADLLILDDPTAGLDVLARDEMLTMLREYMEIEGRAILISSHISSDLEDFCDDIYMIDHGQVILHEETDTLLNEYGLLKVDGKQYERLDKTYVLRSRKETFGYSCLTNEKQFYQESYPDIVVEKGSIDELIMMMVRGDRS